MLMDHARGLHRESPAEARQRLNARVNWPQAVLFRRSPEGTYTVEAWLNTQPEKQFAAAANFLRVLPQPKSTERRQ